MFIELGFSTSKSQPYNIIVNRQVVRNIRNISGFSSLYLNNQEVDTLSRGKSRKKGIAEKLEKQPMYKENIQQETREKR